MATDLEVKMKVDSTQVDEATKKVNGLNNSVKQTETTTRDFGKSVKIAFDESGKAVDVLVDKELSLTKQIRAVKAQMEILTATGKAQGQEFTALQRKFNDLNDNLAQNKARSQELFGTLSLLPGPVGEFSSKLQGGMDLLKTFSGVRLQDLKNQFKGLVDDLKGIFAGFNEFTKKETGGKAGETGGGGAGTAGPTVAAGGDPITEALKKRKQALEEYTKANGTANIKNMAYDETSGKMVSQMENITKASNGAKGSIQSQTAATNGLTKASTGAKTAIQGQTNATNTLTAAETTATTATTLLKAALAALGIGIIIAGIVAFVNAMSELIFKTKESTKEFNKFAEGIKLSKQALDDELTTIQNWNQNRINILKKQNADASVIRNEEINGLKKQREAVEREVKGMDATVQDALDTYTKYSGGLINNMFFKDEYGKAKENYVNAVNQQKELVSKNVALNQQIINKGVEDEIATAQAGYAKKLADLDAQIQLEISSEQTNSEKLTKLLADRYDMVVSHDKLLYHQRELLRKENNKKVVEALDEDSKRTEAYYNKIEDIEISAIENTEKGKEQAELRTRTAKLNRDIQALNYDKEFLISSTEEKQEIIDNLNKAFEQDETTIKQNYAKKRLSIQKELVDLNIKSIRDEVVRSRVERIKQFQDEKDKLDEYLKDGVITRQQYNDAILNMQKAFANDIEKINTDARIKELENQKAVDESRLKILQMNMDQSNATRLVHINDFIAQQLKVEEDNFLIEKERHKNNANELLRIDQEHANNVASIKEAERQQKLAIYNKGLDDLVGIFAAESDLQKGAIILKQTLLAIELGMEIKKTIASAKLTVAKSKLDLASGAASTAKIGFPQNVITIALYAIQAAAIATTIATAFKGIGKSDVKAEAPPMGANYGRGGIIEGPLHRSAAGGTPIMAEGGEAVMTRGAVAQFRPLLSAMNQMGGGTAFSGGVTGQAPFDNPATAEKTMEPQIIKTYIVERDLTSTQERQARLKSLSTL